jgi:membrane fusion protein, multidrug efflux system
MKKRTLIFSVLFLIGFYGCSDKKEPAATATVPSAPHYQLVRLEKGSVSQVTKLPAQLAAYQEVSIFPKVNGYVVSVLVDVGSHVSQGQLLMILEAPELIEAVTQAKERYAQALSGYAISRDNYDRLREAAGTPGAISPMDLVSARSKMDADSALGNAEKANWHRQEAMMGYLRVTAPFDGVITIRNVHPGALVSAESKDNPMLELKEIKRLRLQIDVPEGVAGTLHLNDTLSYYLNAFPGKKMTGKIARISMNINRQFRSERIELDVYNNDEVLAPGMYADVLFESRSNPAALVVPKSAVVTSTERKYLVVLRDGQTVKVDVSTGNESSNRIEIFGNVQPGEEVIANANDEIREGITIK